MDPQTEQAQEGVTEAEKAAGTATEAQGGTDWKAEARKWEQRAKENKAASDELEAIKAAQMTEAEKAAAHLKEVEAELQALKAESQKRADVEAVSKATGVPASLLSYCTDREAMDAFAAEYAAANPHKSAAPAAPTARIAGGAGARPTASEEWAAYMQTKLERRRQ